MTVARAIRLIALLMGMAAAGCGDEWEPLSGCAEGGFGNLLEGAALQRDVDFLALYSGSSFQITDEDPEVHQTKSADLEGTRVRPDGAGYQVSTDVYGSCDMRHQRITLHVAPDGTTGQREAEAVGPVRRCEASL